ncbi:MAG: GGDEF domain-containing protein [Edaphobacter sp.]|uniref:GGDEF domain-containing protein n=1 Tax=Edaphobacter sp. TaxID=1934404 RepID=UPI0023901DA9|nr:GGDEF domain-containing protein [Edaphobacter sp.]MDE1176671.1 GGDEF domain-containing protein [Edaphobacter sp.]
MDRLTLFSMQGGLLIFMGIVIFSVWRAQRRDYSDNGPVWFSLGFILGGIGLSLQAYRGVIAPFYAIILGNFLFFMTYVFMERAIAITTRRTSHMFWLLGLNVATILSYAYFTYVRPDVVIRTLEAVLIMPVMQLPIWIHLARCKEKTIRPALRAMAIVLYLHILLGFVRILGVAMFHHADAWFTWSGLVAIAGLSLSFLWIDSLRVRDELERRAMTDPLTGLLNRRALDDFGRRELSRTIRLNLPCSALALDLNRFKHINDTWGHAAGDRALCAVAEALLSSLRITDLATRIGGDEFFVLLPEASELDADLICTRIRSAIQKISIPASPGQSFSIAVSIGCVTARGKDMTVASLYHDSDIRLYHEKNTTRRNDSLELLPRDIARTSFDDLKPLALRS